MEGREEERIYEEEYIQSHSIFYSIGGFQKPSVCTSLVSDGGSCCRELSGFTKMSTETGPSRSEAEESSGNLMPVLPSCLSTAWKPKAQLLLIWRCSRVPPGPGICDRGNSRCCHSICC